MPPSSRLLRQSSQMKKSSPLSVRIRREDFYDDRRAAAAASLTGGRTNPRSAGHDRWPMRGTLLPIDADFRDSKVPRC